MCPEVLRLDENSPIPLYEQLASQLRDKIRAGELEPGEPIPTEAELSAMYGVSRTTARQAVLTLTRDGLVHRKRGKGSFVSQPKIVQQLVTLRSFSDEIRILGFKPGARLIGKEWVPADEDVAQALQVKAGDPVLRIVRLRLAGEKELSINASHFARHHGLILENFDLGAPSLYCLVEAHVGPVTRATEVITAVTATEEQARHLIVPPGAPLLRLGRTTYISGGYPVEFVRADFRPDRYTFFVELKA
ncbi:MAG TPA: GntR family transcriptional regulator [Bacillota bacterium]|mgnify:CR=1 FL=1|jgi:GntR family transcriptional regulator|nr:GntR family transcriptional regulator [Bacillota bacterium]